jgi:hypothetical protein
VSRQAAFFLSGNPHAPLAVFDDGSADAAEAVLPRAVSYVKPNRLTYL